MSLISLMFYILCFVFDFHKIYCETTLASWSFQAISPPQKKTVYSTAPWKYGPTGSPSSMGRSLRSIRLWSARSVGRRCTPPGWFDPRRSSHRSGPPQAPLCASWAAQRRKVLHGDHCAGSRRMVAAGQRGWRRWWGTWFPHRPRRGELGRAPRKSVSETLHESIFRGYRPQAQYHWAPVLRQCDSCEPLLATESEFMGAKLCFDFQFVDDAFILQSSVSGVLKVNQALQEFSDKFRHRFKGGSKRAAVLPVGNMKPNEEILVTFHQERTRGQCWQAACPGPNHYNIATAVGRGLCQVHGTNCWTQCIVIQLRSWPAIADCSVWVTGHA